MKRLAVTLAVVMISLLAPTTEAWADGEEPQQSKPTYQLTSGDGIVHFFLKEGYKSTEVTKASEGATIVVSPDFDMIPAGKYATGEYTSDQVMVTPALDEDTGMPKNTSDGQFTMPAMAVTVSAVLADQGEYLVDLFNSTSQAIPETMWTLLYSLDYGNEDPESPQYNTFDETGNRYLDLNLDGENDLYVKEDVNEATQVVTYSLIRLTGADKVENCRFALNYVLPYPYNRVYFKLNAIAIKPEWIGLSQQSYEYDGTAKEPTVTVTDGQTIIDSKEYSVSYSNNTDAGTATVILTDVAGGDYNVSGTATFTIARKPVTVKADKQKKYAHAADPELTATVSGLIDADKQKTGIIAYTISRAEGEKTGTYDITPQGDAEQGNYTVSYEGAKLYILHAPSPYGVWVNEIAVTADNRLDILGDGDAAAQKAPSVQYFDDEELLVLTNATVETIESEGDLEIYLAPGSQNKVGSITRGINDPQDPDENVAQTRTETFIIIGGRLLIVDTDRNFPGSIDFTTNRATVGGYDDVAISPSLACFDAKRKQIDVSSLAEGADVDIAAIEGKDKVIDGMGVNVSALAGAIAAAPDIEAGSKVTVSLRAEDGAISVTSTKSGAAGDEGSTDDGSSNATDATSPVSIHMQNYGQEGGDKVKEDGNGNVLSFKGEPGAEPIYHFYNPDRGEHFYTKNPAERDALKAMGWGWEDFWYAGGASAGASASSVSGDFPSGVSIQTAAGSTDINVISEENGGATLGAAVEVTGLDFSVLGNLAEVLNSMDPALIDDTDETGEDSGGEGDGPGEDSVDDGNEDKPVFEIQGTVLKKYNGQDKKCTIPRSVKTIGKSAFSGCTSITTLILSDKVTIIQPTAFSGCTNLKKVLRGPKSRLRTIKKYAFQGCTSLKTFNLYKVKKIDNKAFKGCKNFNVSKNKTNKNVYKALPVTVQVGSGGRKTTRITVNSSEPTTVVLFKESAAIGGSKTRGDGNNAEESELLIHNIQITPRKIYACNSIAEVTDGEYVGLENIQQELPGQKVTGDDADLPKPGDVNGDDVVNAVDVVMTNNYIKGIFSSVFYDSAADLNDDYTIDQDDVDEMVKLILKQKSN